MGRQQKQAVLDCEWKTKKTKLLKQNAETIKPDTVNHLSVEEVKKFTYLGSTVTTDEDSSKEAAVRITNA